MQKKTTKKKSASKGKSSAIKVRSSANGKKKSKTRLTPRPARTPKTHREKNTVKRTHTRAVAAAATVPEAPLPKPGEVGFSFPTENEMMSYFAAPANLTKKAEVQTHRLSDVDDLSCLCFDWNKRALDQEHVEKLAHSIKLRGVLEPIVIAADYSIVGHPTLQVVRGHHRVEAMRLLRMKAARGDITLSRANQKIPAEVVIYKGEQDYRSDKRQQWGDAASNIPELIKKDDVFARADYFAEIQQSLAKGSTGKVARSLGLSRSTIRDAMNVLELPPTLQKLMRENVKVLKEKFMYKVASRYSKVRRQWLKEIKERAAAEIGLDLPAREMVKPNGTVVMIKGAVPAEHQEAFSAALTRIKESEAENLKARQKEREKELLKMVKAEIAAQKGDGKRAGASADVGGGTFAMPVVRKALQEILGQLSDTETYTKADITGIFEVLATARRGATAMAQQDTANAIMEM